MKTKRYEMPASVNLSSSVDRQAAQRIEIIFNKNTTEALQSVRQCSWMPAEFVSSEKRMPIIINARVC